MKNYPYIQISTTTENKEEAQLIAGKVVERRLAACAQIIGPVKSIYWWEGEMEESEEWLCLIKSSAALFERLETAVREIHPYETPEIVAVPITAGSAGYLAWLGESLGGG